MRKIADRPSSLDERHEWLLLGAKEKVASILTLTRGTHIRSVLEVGCGTGAVLEHLDRAGFAECYDAIEPSAELLNYMTRRGAIARLADADATTLGVPASALALRIWLSSPMRARRNPGRPSPTRSTSVNSFSSRSPSRRLPGNVRSTLKRWLTRHLERENPAGHIQFFGYGDIQELVHWCGGDILSSRLYVPRAQLWHEFASESLPRKAYHGVVLSLSRLAPSLWARLYHGHCAVLVGPGRLWRRLAGRGVRKPHEPTSQPRSSDRDSRLLHVVHHPVFGGPHNQALRLGGAASTAGMEYARAAAGRAGECLASACARAALSVVTMSACIGCEPRGIIVGTQVRFAGGFWPEVAAIRRLIRARNVDVVVIGGLVNPHAASRCATGGVPVVWQILDTRPPMRCADC